MLFTLVLFAFLPECTALDSTSILHSTNSTSTLSLHVIALILGGILVSLVSLSRYCRKQKKILVSPSDLSGTIPSSKPTKLPVPSDMSTQSAEPSKIPSSKPEFKFTLDERVRFEGSANGWVLPLCGKPALLKQFLAVPSLLPAYIRTALASKPNENFIIFIADGMPMAKQVGSFSGRLNKALKQVTQACVGLDRLAREAVASLSEQEQNRLKFVSWTELVINDARYEEWYQFIMNNEETRQIIKETALGIAKYRVDSFTKKGLKCVKFFDEEGNLLTDSQKVMNRYLWTQESIAREITTLIWGFHLNDSDEKLFYNSLFYMTPNSTGMDLISGGSDRIRQVLESKKLIEDLPKRAALHYLDLTVEKQTQNNPEVSKNITTESVNASQEDLINSTNKEFGGRITAEDQDGERTNTIHKLSLRDFRTRH